MLDDVFLVELLNNILSTQDPHFPTAPHDTALPHCLQGYVGNLLPINARITLNPTSNHNPSVMSVRQAVHGSETIQYCELLFYFVCYLGAGLPDLTPYRKQKSSMRASKVK